MGSSSRNAGSTGRRRRGSISREKIVDAAHAILARSPDEPLTIRLLAAELDVAPMSLYRHIDSKTDVLDEVVDNLLARVPAPRTDASDWRAFVVAGADAFREFLVSQPAALQVYLSHPVDSPAAVARMDAMTQALRAAGCSAREAERGFASIHTYTLGFAALEANRAAHVEAIGDSDLEIRLAAFTTPGQFLVGLGYLLDGIVAAPPVS